ncbi:MAG: hypothetical protein A3F68_09460 [Acidobacteria bacterium RIFCSPLOWO2_12_FULL_54_10]|nr:MAG: hypothetical protein A3F68_09460 [Acidobacteria bacterium RIFCSPLOWO2_12_FULL_54_10]
MLPPVLKDYSIKIKELRSRLHLTQHELAERIGVRPAAVGWWEQGRWEPSGENYVLLARLAPPDLAWFFLGKVGVDHELIRRIWPGVPHLPPSASAPAADGSSPPPAGAVP